MQVYGDQTRRVSALGLLHEVETDLAAGARLSALIGLGQLAQGVADAEHQRRGGDGRSPAQDALMAGLTAMARGEAPALRPDPAWPGEIETRIPEGYAFYALHPALYAAAARQLPPGDWRVIGLRSIGTSLSAVVAAALGAAPPITVRPVGDPFARAVALLPELQAELRAHDGPFAIVDEGPGLSGSSFGAVADALEGLAISPERIVFLPGHGGDLGPEASAAHRARWRSARRPVSTFEAVALPELVRAAEALVGESAAALQDISGGTWRERVRELQSAPVFAAQERRKFLLRTGSGVWLLKFAGLGRIGERKLARARCLHAAGWTPEPAGLAEGFLVERWREDARPGVPSAGALSDYLALRAAAPAEAGARAETLWTMARANASEALGPAAARAFEARRPDFGTLDALTRPVEIDGRMHRWEWRVTPDGRPLKTDALDHGEAHDLVGAQDIAWDLAGAEVELALSLEETDAIRRALEVRPELLAFHRLAYPAFQLGLWTLAGETLQAGIYARRLAALLGVDPPPPSG